MGNSSSSKLTVFSGSSSSVPLHENKFKILIVGDSFVGKTCLLLRVCDNTFTETAVNMVESFKSRQIEVNGEKITLNLWDTGGQERFRTITSSFYSGMQLAIVCFALSNRDSWESVEKWHNEIQRYSDENAKNIVIVGTKDDLESVVSDEEVMQFMFDRDMCSGGAGYIRISSKVGTNSELLLHMLGRILLSEYENLDLLETFIISPELKSKYSSLVRDSEYNALMQLIKDQQLNYKKLSKDNRHIEEKFKQPQEKLNELLNNLKKNPNVSMKEMSLIKNDSDILESYIQDIISGKKVCYYFEGSDEGDYDTTKEKRKTFTKKDMKDIKEGKEEKRDSIDSESYGSNNPKAKYRGTRTGKLGIESNPRVLTSSSPNLIPSSAITLNIPPYSPNPPPSPSMPSTPSPSMPSPSTPSPSMPPPSPSPSVPSPSVPSPSVQPTSPSSSKVSSKTSSHSTPSLLPASAMGSPSIQSSDIGSFPLKPKLTSSASVNNAPVRPNRPAPLIAQDRNFDKNTEKFVVDKADRSEKSEKSESEASGTSETSDREKVESFKGFQNRKITRVTYQTKYEASYLEKVWDNIIEFNYADEVAYEFYCKQQDEDDEEDELNKTERKKLPTRGPSLSVMTVVNEEEPIAPLGRLPTLPSLPKKGSKKSTTNYTNSYTNNNNKNTNSTNYSGSNYVNSDSEHLSFVKGSNNRASPSIKIGRKSESLNYTNSSGTNYTNSSGTNYTNSSGTNYTNSSGTNYTNNGTNYTGLSNSGKNATNYINTTNYTNLSNSGNSYDAYKVSYPTNYSGGTNYTNYGPENYTEIPSSGQGYSYSSYSISEEFNELNYSGGSSNYSQSTNYSNSKTIDIVASDSKDGKLTENKGKYYWSEQFQEIYLRNDNLQKFERLYSLAKDFVDYAVAYSKIIISELGLSYEEKTLKPTAIGGFAGGSKWICNGILFKFALDVPLKGGTYIYGGAEKNDEKAMKSACNERKGLLSYFQSCDYDVNFPLMAIISYRGFCLCAQSLLPIDKSTIVYGSCDGGVTVSASDPFLNEIMDEFGKKLNLAKHRVSKSELLITGPTDIEAHYGKDEKYYILDFGRVFPPEFPNTFQEVMYNLLRPNLLHHPQIIKKGVLCSDAFLGFIPKEDQHAEINKIRDTTIILRDVIIPELARELNKDPATFGEITSENLASVIHREGINCRHLGRIRKYLEKENLRRIFLTEIVARTLKNVVRGILRKQMNDSSSYRLGPSKIIAKFCQVSFGFKRKNNEATDNLYCMLLKDFINLRFPNSLSEEESDLDFNLRKSVNMLTLLQRFQQMTGIIMDPRIYEYYSNNSLSLESYFNGSNQYDKLLLNSDLIIREDDIHDLNPIISFMHIVNFAYAAKISIQCKYRINIEREVAKREILGALNKLDQVVLESSLVRHIPMEFYLGSLLIQVAEILFDDTNYDHTGKSRTNRREVKAAILDEDVRGIVAEKIVKNYFKAEDCFRMIIAQSKNHNTYFHDSVLNMVTVKCGIYIIQQRSFKADTQLLRGCSHLLKKSTKERIVKFIDYLYFSFFWKQKMAKKLAILIMNVVIHNPHFCFKLLDKSEKHNFNEISVRHSMFLSKIKPSTVIIHLFEEDNQTTSRLIRFKVKNDGTNLIIENSDDIYPENNISTPSKGYFDISPDGNNSNFVLVINKVLVETTTQVIIRGHHDGHYVYCDEERMYTQHGVLRKEVKKLKGIMIIPNLKVFPHWAFSFTNDKEYCSQFILTNINRCKSFRQFFQLLSVLATNGVRVPDSIDLMPLFSLPHMSDNDVLLYYSYLKKNIIKLKNNSNNSNNIMNDLLDLWKKHYNPQKEMVDIVIEKLNLCEGQFNKDYWVANIIELIHEEIILELISTEISLLILKNCFSGQPPEFQLIFISNWMIARKVEFKDILVEYQPAEFLFLKNSFLFSELIRCSILNKIPIPNVLMIYDLKLDIGNLENNIRRALLYQQLPKITSIELHMGSCDLRKFSDNICHLFEITKTTFFSLQSNKLESLPYQIGMMVNLSSLNLFDNRLTALPESIGNLTKLMDLSLSRNLLVNLPESFKLLTSLTRLNISDNRIASIPSSMTLLTKLNYLDVSKFDGKTFTEKALSNSKDINTFILQRSTNLNVSK